MPAAKQIISAALQCPSRFDGYVWIHELAEVMGMTVEALAPYIWECKTEGSIEAKRCDLVSRPDAGHRVTLSEIRHPYMESACVHLVRIQPVYTEFFFEGQWQPFDGYARTVGLTPEQAIAEGLQVR